MYLVVKLDFFLSQTDTKYLDSFYMTDLDFWCSFGREKPILTLLHSERPILAFVSVIELKLNYLRLSFIYEVNLGREIPAYIQI